MARGTKGRVKPKKRQPNVRVTGNLTECVASVIDIVAKIEKRITRLEKASGRRLIGFGANAESNIELPDPDEDEIWESGPVGGL